MMQRITLLAGLLVLLACDGSPPSGAHLPQPIPAPAPAALSPAARAQLDGTIDLDALDRLLNSLGPQDRALYLQSFADVEQVASGHPGETRDVSIITFTDPERRQLSERVWAPAYAHLPPEVLSDPSYPLPGRMLAAARRAADSAAAVKKEREP